MWEECRKILIAVLVAILIALLILVGAYVYCWMNGIPATPRGGNGFGGAGSLICCACAMTICSGRRRK